MYSFRLLAQIDKFYDKFFLNIYPLIEHTLAKTPFSNIEPYIDLKASYDLHTFHWAYFHYFLTRTIYHYPQLEKTKR